MPNWETSEVDDVNFPALHGEGFTVRDGAAKLSDLPGLGVRVDESKLEAPTVELKG